MKCGKFLDYLEDLLSSEEGLSSLIFGIKNTKISTGVPKNDFCVENFALSQLVFFFRYGP